MADYNVVLPEEYAAGAPMDTVLFSRLVQNPEAMFEGAAGAPRLSLRALPEVTAGEVQRMHVTAILKNGTEVYTPVWGYTCLQEGFLRMRFDHRANNSFAKSEVRVYVGGVLQASFATVQGDTTVWKSEVVDLAVSRGDYISLDARVSNDNPGAPSEIQDLKLLTGGEELFPLLIPNATWSFT